MATFLKAQNIGNSELTLVVMGNAIYRLLISDEGFDNAIGTHQPLQAVIGRSTASNSALKALIIPSTLSMLKDAHSKKLAWSSLKSYLTWNDS